MYYPGTSDFAGLVIAITLVLVAWALRKRLGTIAVTMLTIPALVVASCYVGLWLMELDDPERGYELHPNVILMIVWRRAVCGIPLAVLAAAASCLSAWAWRRLRAGGRRGAFVPSPVVPCKDA
jgi:hypothetical protein